MSNYFMCGTDNVVCTDGTPIKAGTLASVIKKELGVVRLNIGSDDCPINIEISEKQFSDFFPVEILEE